MAPLDLGEGLGHEVEVMECQASLLRHKWAATQPPFADGDEMVRRREFDVQLEYALSFGIALRISS